MESAYPSLSTVKVSGVAYWRGRLSRDVTVHLARDAESSGAEPGSMAEHEARAMLERVYAVFAAGGDWKNEAKAARAEHAAANAPPPAAPEFEPLTGYPPEIIEQMLEAGYDVPPWPNGDDGHQVPAYRAGSKARPDWVYLGNHLAWRTDLQRPVPIGCDVWRLVKKPGMIRWMHIDWAELPRDVPLDSWRVLYPGEHIRGNIWCPVLEHPETGERLWWFHELMPFDDPRTIPPDSALERHYAKFGITRLGAENKSVLDGSAAEGLL